MADKVDRIVIFGIVILAVFLSLFFIIAAMKPVWEKKENPMQPAMLQKKELLTNEEKLQAIEERRAIKEANDPRTEEEKRADDEDKLKIIEERRQQKIN